jgi:predicted DNA-binding transcriptional regulator YafY
MRLEKAAGLLALARRLASSAEGLTLDDMAVELGAHRRTAMRMRDALAELFPHMEEITEGRLKRYRITNGLDGLYQSPSAEELATLAACAEALRAEGADVRASALESLDAKVRSAMRSKALNRLVPDLEALVRAECVAVQAGPRIAEDEAVLATLRLALLSMKRVAFDYDGGSTPGARRMATPYGLLFGRQNYLVGDEGGPAPEIKHWRLDRMSAVGLLEEVATPPADFDLRRHAEGSFGIFQDGLDDVALRVSPEASAEAVRWRFHPAQTVEPLPDGGFRVRFRTSGMLELAWHIMTWGDQITVEGPERLRAILRDQVVALSRHLGLPGHAPSTEQKAP